MSARSSASRPRGAPADGAPHQRAPTSPVCVRASRRGSARAGPRVLAADVDAFNLLLEMKLKRRRERPHLPRTVTELVAEDGSRVYVVGTAHFSDDSKKDVVKVTAARALAGPASQHQSPGSVSPAGPPCAPSLPGQASLFRNFLLSVA